MNTQEKLEHKAAGYGVTYCELRLAEVERLADEFGKNTRLGTLRDALLYRLLGLGWSGDEIVAARSRRDLLDEMACAAIGEEHNGSTLKLVAKQKGQKQVTLVTLRPEQDGAGEAVVA